MKNNKFYLLRGKVWIAQDKKLKLQSVSNPEEKIDYASLHPDEAQSLKEVRPNPKTYVHDSPQERLYRVLTDLSTVKFLNEDSFRDVSGKVSSYLEELEEWERMCLIRDITEFYNAHRSKRRQEVDELIRKNDERAANGK